MRPERLEVRGFTAFREQTVVDFSDVELFALTGPTGAGKSSLIDALTFALYGSVARYDDHRRVEPIISSGMNEARVRFDFDLEGRRLTAVRVVRRTDKGATTSEARLEETDGEVLASGASDVTDAVTRLTGLGFSHFTRSVVLPQGEFARFLHDKPGDRQAFLKQLLDIGVLERVRELGRQRLQTGKQESEFRAERLRALEHATEEAEADLEGREKRLGALVDEVAAMTTGLSQLEERIEKRRKTITGLEDDRSLLAGIELPKGLDSLSDDLIRTEKEVAETAARLETAESNLQEAGGVRYELPKLSEVERLEQERDSLAKVTEEREGLRDPSGEYQTLKEQLRDAEALVYARESELENLRTSHAAAALLTGVAPGDPCPVCHRNLDEMPTHSGRDDVDAAEKALRESKDDYEAIRRQHDESGKVLERYRTRVEDLDERVETLTALVASTPDDLAALKGSVLEAEKAYEDAQEAKIAAAASHEKAKTDQTAVRQRSHEARADFEKVRYGVARLDPPVPEGGDPRVHWEEITGWAGRKLGIIDVETRELKKDLETLTEEVEEKRNAVLVRFRDDDLAPGDDPRMTAARAHERAIKELAELRAARVEAEDLRNTLIVLEKDAELAKTLGEHLRANRFEGWLLEEALYDLVEGANRLLGDLSSGNFSLDVEERAFVIIDHRNLDARRNVKTLSGGETFLVSLALALSLASQLGEMSSQGAARLDAVFLDEGFGTLDGETLETVASVVTELASRGRIVGLVTHVRELADQMPVRYVVVRDASGARVERHDR